MNIKGERGKRVKGRNEGRKTERKTRKNRIKMDGIITRMEYSNERRMAKMNEKIKGRKERGRKGFEKESITRRTLLSSLIGRGLGVRCLVQ